MIYFYGVNIINYINKKKGVSMKIFFDTEFTGLHQKTTLISIGLISEDNKTFYAEFIDFDKQQINDWLQKNVINNLLFKTDIYKRLGFYETSNNSVIQCGVKKEIAYSLKVWMEQFETIEIWSDCLSYDWVLFNDLIADYSNGYPKLPKNINYIPFDICTLFKIKGIDPDINRENFANIETKKHNALEDAKVIKLCYEKLMK
jgi:hypothetical protein